MPEEYLDVLRVANGFAADRDFFRYFSVGGGSTADVDQWNRAEWKALYGTLVRGVAIVAEDVFGDQYGYTQPGETLVKVYCEGGDVQPIGYRELRAAPRGAWAVGGDIPGISPGMTGGFTFLAARPYVALGASHFTPFMEVNGK